MRAATSEGMEQPKAYCVPSIGISGLMLYTGDRFPNWKGNLFIGGMAGNYRQLVRVLGERRTSSRIASRCCRASTESATCARVRTASSTSPSTTSSRAAEQHHSARAESAVTARPLEGATRNRCARRTRGGRNPRRRTSAVRPRLPHAVHRRIFRRAARERRGRLAPSGARTHHRQRRREAARGHFLG